MTKSTNVQSSNSNMSNCQNTNLNAKELKLKVVYRLDFAIRLKEMGYVEAFSKRNPQKPWLLCWYFVETDSFLADLQKLMEESKNERI